MYVWVQTLYAQWYQLKGPCVSFGIFQCLKIDFMNFQPELDISTKSLCNPQTINLSFHTPFTFNYNNFLTVLRRRFNGSKQERSSREDERLASKNRKLLFFFFLLRTFRLKLSPLATHSQLLRTWRWLKNLSLWSLRKDNPSKLVIRLLSV